MKKIFIRSSFTSMTTLKYYALSIYKLLNKHQIDVSLIDTQRTYDMDSTYTKLKYSVEPKLLGEDLQSTLILDVSNILDKEPYDLIKFIDLDNPYDKNLQNTISQYYNTNNIAVPSSFAAVNDNVNIFPYYVDTLDFNPDVKETNFNNVIADIKFVYNLKHISDVPMVVDIFSKLKELKTKKIHLVILTLNYIKQDENMLAVSTLISQQLVKQIKERKHKNLIVTLINDFLSQKEIASLYKYADYFININMCAFNRMFLEAMAVGTPSIISSIGGHVDYINNQNKNFIEIDLKNAEVTKDKVSFNVEDLRSALSKAIALFGTKTYDKYVSDGFTIAHNYSLENGTIPKFLNDRINK